MAESDEFTLLCEAILDDGEVSADEAYKLAGWLNEHPAVAQTWPGRELIEPLQEIWADGTVNRRELQRVARLLVSLQRQRLTQPEASSSSSGQIALPVFTSVATGGARLPSVDARMQIPSSKESSALHEVDLNGPQCSCADWRDRRSHLPAGHLTRCCKHIFAAYAQLPRDSTGESWLRAFVDHGWPAHPRTDWELLTIEKEAVLISNAANKGWANVFAKENDEYKRFCYSVEEHRWAYDSPPRWAWVITDAIRSLEEATKPGRKIPQPEAPAPTHARRAFSAMWLFAAGAVVAVIAILRSCR